MTKSKLSSTLRLAIPFLVLSYTAEAFIKADFRLHFSPGCGLCGYLNRYNNYHHNGPSHTQGQQTLQTQSNHVHGNKGYGGGHYVSNSPTDQAIRVAKHENSPYQHNHGMQFNTLEIHHPNSYIVKEYDHHEKGQENEGQFRSEKESSSSGPKDNKGFEENVKVEFVEKTPVMNTFHGNGGLKFLFGKMPHSAHGSVSNSNPVYNQISNFNYKIPQQQQYNPQQSNQGHPSEFQKIPQYLNPPQSTPAKSSHSGSEVEQRNNFAQDSNSKNKGYGGLHQSKNYNGNGQEFTNSNYNSLNQPEYEYAPVGDFDGMYFGSESNKNNNNNYGNSYQTIVGMDYNPSQQQMQYSTSNSVQTIAKPVIRRNVTETARVVNPTLSPLPQKIIVIDSRQLQTSSVPIKGQVFSVKDGRFVGNVLLRKKTT